jgi:hypothetical protein
VRCGRDLGPGSGKLIRLAVLVGDPPATPIRWDHALPWPSVPICAHCVKWIGHLLATRPSHRYLAAAETKEEPDLVGRPGRRPTVLATDLDHRVRRSRDRED